MAFTVEEMVVPALNAVSTVPSAFNRAIPWRNVGPDPTEDRPTNTLPSDSGTRRVALLNVVGGTKTGSTVPLAASFATPVRVTPFTELKLPEIQTDPSGWATTSLRLPLTPVPMTNPGST